MLCTEKTLYRMLCTCSVHKVCTGSLYRLCTGSLYRIPYVHRRCNKVPVQRGLYREIATGAPVQTACTGRKKNLFKTVQNACTDDFFVLPFI